LKVRRAERNDLDLLVTFTAAEAREENGDTKDAKTLADGIKAALKDRTIAVYLVLVNEDNQQVSRLSTIVIYTWEQATATNWRQCSGPKMLPNMSRMQPLQQIS